MNLLALRRSNGTIRFGILATLLAAPLLACTALISRDVDQCSTDADCAHFGGHPYCQSGLCVASNLGPANCFLGDASTALDFLNQCSTAQCVTSDPCQENGICDDDAQAPTYAPDAATTSTSSTSDAAPPPYCSGISPYVVYVAGANALLPFLSVVATLAPTGANYYTLVYANSGSCGGVASQLDADPARHVAKGAAVYFDNSGVSHPCLLDAAGDAVDVGLSDVYASTCGEPNPTAGGSVAEYLGPIQPMAMVVPQSSSQASITAAQAHVIFGTGGAGVAAPDASTFPWTDPSLYFVRNATSGVQLLLAASINVPATQWWGVDRGSSSNVKTQLEAVDPSKADQAIGILSTDDAEAERGKLKYLAFQAVGQDCAYYPDSSFTSKDKENVRNGHYPVWGPIHLFATTTGSEPSLAAQSIVTRFSLTKLDQSVLNATIDTGLIPQCAMTVTRSSELGPVTTQAPDYQCACYMDSRIVGAAAPGCVTCDSGDDCTGVAGKPSCNYGYCEAVN